MKCFKAEAISQLHRWTEVDTVGPGPKMLFPMAWSLLPCWRLASFHQIKQPLATSFLAAGIMLSLFRCMDWYNIYAG